VRTLPGSVSYPLLAEGKVVVTAALPGGRSGTALHVLDARTGRDVRPPVGLGGRHWWSASAYGDGRVYVVNDRGLMRAYTLRTGKLLWRRQLPGQYAFDSAPTFAAGTVYTGGAGGGGTLYAVDARTGRVRWTRTVANGGGSAPAVTSTGVYVAYSCGQAYRFHPETGREMWHHDEGCNGAGGITPVITKGGLWVRDDGTTRERFFDLATGRVRTSAPTKRLYQSTAAFAGRAGFVVRDGRLHAVTTSSPWRSRWTFTGDGDLVTSPLVVDSVVYIASTTGRLTAVDTTSGRTVWSTGLGGTLTPIDEDSTAQPLPGLAAGQGRLVVPVGRRLVAFG